MGPATAPFPGLGPGAQTHHWWPGSDLRLVPRWCLLHLTDRFSGILVLGQLPKGGERTAFARRGSREPVPEQSGKSSGVSSEGPEPDRHPDALPTGQMRYLLAGPTSLPHAAARLSEAPAASDPRPESSAVGRGSQPGQWAPPLVLLLLRQVRAFLVSRPHLRTGALTTALLS